MPISMRPDDVRKINLIKYVYQQALNYTAVENNIIRQALAVIHFDLAIEMTFGSIISTLDPSAALDSKNFPSLLKQAEDLLTNKSLGSMPDKVQINKVHNIRNDAQHRLKYPSSLTVSDCRTYTHDFLQKVTLLIWGKNFDEVSVAQLISHPKIRDYLLNAESAFAQKKYLDSAKQAGSGLEKTISFVKPFIVGFEPPHFKGIVLGDHYSSRDHIVNENMLKSFGKIQNSLLVLLLSLNYTSFMKYRKIVGDAINIPGGEVHFSKIDEQIFNSPIAEKTSEFIISFCIDSILQIEDTVGDLEKPFGEDERDLW